YGLGMTEILEILAEFGGGRGNPANTAVRFLLPSLFWAFLVGVAFRQWLRLKNNKDLYVGIAAIAGICREMFMFISEYGGWKGIVSFNFPYLYYPPFEHSAAMVAGILIGYAFLSYFLDWKRLPRSFLFIGLGTTAILYTVTAPLWISYLRDHPGTLFGAFWGDMAFRVSASILLGTVLGSFVFAKNKGVRIPLALIIGFSFLFLDEFLMIFNLANKEKYIQIYAPIRHNLHIWSIPLFLAVYWNELSTKLSDAVKAKDSMFELSPNMLCIFDSGGIISIASPAASDIVGHSPKELSGMKVEELGFSDIYLSELSTLLKPGETSSAVSYEDIYVAPDQKERWLKWKIQPVPSEGLFYAVVSDITEIRHRDEERSKLEKLQSLGILAGGIAHDFNNLLSAMVGNISIVKMTSAPDNATLERLEEVEKACVRAKDLTLQLLTFARGGAPVKRTAELPDLIKDTSKFAISGSSARCTWSIPDDLWPVDIDEGQISQVVHNIILNGKQAMPGGGTINISAKNVTIEEGDTLPLMEGKFIRISFEDQGTGIAESHVKKIFDPYFTTRQDGNGLGLATSYSIIKNHNGHIAVRSEPGVGSVFDVYLPASTRQAIVKEAKQDEKPHPAQGRILLMDDEEALVKAVTYMLRYRGYDIECASNGDETLELYSQAKRSGQPFDLIIMDLTIRGGMGGKETMNKLLEIDPDVKAIVSSGYSSDPVMAHYKKYGFSGIIAKPYRAEELFSVLQYVMNNDVA
ncbi:MAG: ATP-binding protein, partial [Thermodesulfovibrionales bacterium]